MKRILSPLLFLLLFSTVVACSTQSDAQVSILEKSNCDLPCWNDIVVGKTSEKELLSILSASPIIDQESIHATEQQWFIFDNQVLFSLLPSSKSIFHHDEISASVQIENGLVRMLDLCGGLNTKIGEIVTAVGEPEYIISGGSIAGGRDVILINPNVGISYWYNTDNQPKDFELEINPETQVSCLYLFVPENYEILMEAGMFSSGHYNAEETLRVMYPWDEYGNLDEKYPPRQP